MGRIDAVVLLSGGLDSATCLAVARSRGLACACLTVDYGQRHRAEIEAARRIAAHLGAAEHVISTLDLRLYGGSALTGPIDVPKDVRSPGEGAIPVTYVPARNTILLALALGLAEARGAREIFIGANAVDYSGYPDCRGPFLRIFEQLANLATRDGVEAAERGATAFRVQAPLLELPKPEIIRLGARLGVDFAMTRTCYDPAGDLACGRCEACVLRSRGFAAAGVPDPTRYARVHAT